MRAGFAALAREVGDARAPEEIADGAIRIAVESMANAIKKISVERGYDVTEYALNCFGSAGGQHACLIADTLGIETILIHPLSGLLSAYGMGLAPMRASRERSVEAPLDADTMHTIETLAYELGSDVTEELLDEGVEHDDIALTTHLHLRYAGTDTALPVELSEPGFMRRDFEALHRQRFGFVSPEKEIFVAAIEVEATGSEALDGPPTHSPPPGGEGLGVGGSSTANGNNSASPKSLHPTPDPSPLRGGESNQASRRDAQTTRFYSRGAWHEAPVVRREALTVDATVSGPALVIEPHQTVVVEPGWTLVVSDADDLVLTRTEPRPRERLGREADPILLEVFNNLFMAIAEQMGEALRNTAQSVNIKERLDFSCAVFDADGHLVANAPHLPVHLGSMDRSVETIIRLRASEMRPGDVYMLNAPYNGGTHLPDITVVTPVFDDAGSEVLFYVASRGHHEDIGGLTPGSMTPRATTIEEEGVYIDNVKLVAEGRFLEAETRALLTGAKYPARQPDKNIADLKAQVAANIKGEAELRRMVAHFGLDVVRAYMGHVQDNAEESVRRLLARLADGHFRVEMDQGSCVEVKITVDREARTAKVDFTGTSEQQPTNFNAPEPVTRAAVLYTFRVMVDEPIPMNAGCLKPIEIVIPEGSMLRPAYPAAVVAGNVEISQVVTNALFAALDALGSSQGTMNNLTFGNENVQYYETLCSGAPAGPGFDGAAAVHVHMTNTRLTDPEILELRYPVLLEEFSIRRGSGGKGKWTKRRRHQARHPFSGAHGLRHPVGLSRCAPLRARRRRAGRGRRQPRAPLRRQPGAIEGLRSDRHRAGRGDHHRDADGRRVRQGVSRLPPFPASAGMTWWVVKRSPPLDVIPAQAGTHASLRDCDTAWTFGERNTGWKVTKGQPLRDVWVFCPCLSRPNLQSWRRHPPRGEGQPRMQIAARATRTQLLILAAALTLGGGAMAAEPVSRKADMTVREITSALFKAKPDERVDLSKRNLAYLDLSGLNFKGATLAHSDLYGVDFTNANLRGTDLAHTRLDRALLTGPISPGPT